MNSNRFTGRIFKYIRKLIMANTEINESENDIEELNIKHEDFTETYSTWEQVTQF